MLIIRACLLIILPFLPVVILIDILIGDIMTGVKISAKDKTFEQWALYKSLWVNKGDK
jgi:hypothetical protein